MNTANVPQTWDGFCSDFWNDVVELSRLDTTRDQLTALDGYTFSGQKPYPFGLPVMVRSSSAKQLEIVYDCYVKLLQIIISQYRINETLQQYITLPAPLAELALQAHPMADRIDLCRLDLFLEPAGGFKILETNANCPGGLIYSGIAADLWRKVLPSSRVAEVMFYESTNWMADWFVERLCGGAANYDFVPIFRETGGHELELSSHRQQFLNRGIGCELADPRDMTSRNGALFWNGRQVDVAYQKIGIPEFCGMLGEMRTYVDALLTGKIRVQNGLLGRWVGDNKLCLAVLSDPRFEELFPTDLLNVVQPHLPWSRNIAWCTDQELETVRRNRRNYVLKRPLDTRGRGVIIGRDVSDDDKWNAHVNTCIRDNWLCMEYVSTTLMQRHDLGGEFVRHDLAVSAINGCLVGGYLRSSKDERVNVALNGRLHPLFFEAGTRVRLAEG